MQATCEEVMTRQRSRDWYANRTKPHIYLLNHGGAPIWVCSSAASYGYGATIVGAYANWRKR